MTPIGFGLAGEDRERYRVVAAARRAKLEAGGGPSLTPEELDAALNEAEGRAVRRRRRIDAEDRRRRAAAREGGGS